MEHIGFNGEKDFRRYWRAGDFFVITLRHSLAAHLLFVSRDCLPFPDYFPGKN
jgi:hypothetical protein